MAGPRAQHQKVSVHFPDGTGVDRYALIDTVTHGQVTTDYAHHEIHEGDSYFIVYSALKDNAGTLEILIATPNTAKWAHMVMAVDFAIAGTAQLWTPTTKTDASGNRLTGFNRNQNSTNTSGLTICHTPGGAQAGTASLSQYIGATATGGRVAVGGSGAGRAEFVLKQNSSYYILATSRADGNAVSIILDWYEHTSET